MSAPVGGRLRRWDALTVVVLVAFAVGAFVFLVPSLRSPGHVDQITLENGQVYEVVVSASASPSAGRSSIGTIRRETTATFTGALDVGPQWVIHFAYGGVDAGRIEVSRADLAAGGWRVVVPAEVGERLRAAGLEPSAR